MLLEVWAWSWGRAGLGQRISILHMKIWVRHREGSLLCKERSGLRQGRWDVLDEAYGAALNCTRPVQPQFMVSVWTKLSLCGDTWQCTTSLISELLTLDLFQISPQVSFRTVFSYLNESSLGSRGSKKDPPFLASFCCSVLNFFFKK